MFADDAVRADHCLDRLHGHVLLESDSEAAGSICQAGTVESQLKDLFGPLLVLDIACFQAVAPMATLYGATGDVAGNVPAATRFIIAGKASEKPASLPLQASVFVHTLNILATVAVFGSGVRRLSVFSCI